MRNQMDRIDNLLGNPQIDFSLISQTMQQIKPYAIEMANLSDHAEVKQHTIAYEDYIKKRYIIFHGLVILMFSVISLVAITLIVFCQQRLTIRQQAKLSKRKKLHAPKMPSCVPSAISCALRYKASCPPLTC